MAIEKPAAQHWWPGGLPARYYAAVISKLRPDLRDKAMGRVPEQLRDMVKTHVDNFKER